MAETEFKYDVFISYSHKDEEWVRSVLLPTLEKQGLKVCIDYRDFIAGRPAIINMQDASEASRHTLLVLTPRWVESEWTLYEGILSRTDDPAGLQRRTIPLLLEKCMPPKFISMLTWVDFTNKKREKEAWKSLFNSLDKKVDKVKVVRAKSESTKAGTRPEGGGVHVGKDVQESVIIVGDGNTVVAGKSDVPAPTPSKPDTSTPDTHR